MGDLPTGKFAGVLLDPPWHFKVHSEKDKKSIRKSAQGHYQCQSLDDIKALPVRDLCLPDAWVVTWATAPMLPHAVLCLEAWGAKYVTAAAWAKQSSTGKKWAFGTGYVCWSAAEFLLIGKVGSPKVKSKSLRNLIITDNWVGPEGPAIVAPVRAHSQKPDQQYEFVEALTDGPWIEVFSRAPHRPGWTFYGNEVGKFDRSLSVEDLI